MLTLYTYFRSSASYRVRIALELKSLAYEPVPVHLVRGGGEQHSAAFAALNSAELVPVLGDDGLTITQSLAIIEYLEEIHPVPSLLPGNAASRARIRAIAQLIACEIHPLNNLRVLQRLESKVGMDKESRDCWYAHWVIEGFRALEAMLAGSADTGRFCHGDSPTMADCCLVPQVYNAHQPAHGDTRVRWSKLARRLRPIASPRRRLIATAVKDGRRRTITVYMRATLAQRGALVYMSTGQVHWLAPE